MRATAQPISPAGLAVVLAAAVCISLSNVLSPVVYGAGTTITGLLVARFTVFPLLCFALIRVQGHSLTLAPRDRLVCFGAGVFYCAGHGSLIASFAYIPVGLGVLILFSFPIVTLIIEAVLDRRMPPPLRSVLALAAFFGLGLAFGFDPQGADLRGVAFAALASVCVSSAFVWSDRGLDDVAPPVMTFYMSLAGIVFAATAALAFGRFEVAVAPVAALAALAAAVLTFNGAFLGMFTGVRMIGAPPTAMLMNMEPLFTLGLAYLVLNETLAPVQMIGAAIVIAAVFAATLNARA